MLSLLASLAAAAAANADVVHVVFRLRSFS